MIKIQLIEMTAVQVLMWFFKEQKSMPLLRETYVSTKPYHSYRNSQNLKWEKRYLSFEEYINASVKSRGFEMVLEQFLRDYENTVMQKLIMTKLGYRNYTNQCNALKNRFSKLMKKWKYFVNHNVFSDSLKVGDKYYFTWYDFIGHNNNLREIELTEISLNRNTVTGNINLDGKNCAYGIWLSNLRDKDGNPIKIEYYIKRGGKIYNGANNK